MKQTHIILGGLTLLLAGTALAAPSPPETSLRNCQNTVRVRGRNFIKNYVNAAGVCLNKIAIEVVKKNADTSKAANTCIAQFRKIKDTRGLGRGLEEKLRAKIEKKCTPGGDNTHTLGDILGNGATVSEPLEAERIGNLCGAFRDDATPPVFGDGEIDTLDEWLNCIVNSHVLLARTAVTVHYPRALEWLDEVRDEMALVSPPSGDPPKVDDALAGIDAFIAGVEQIGEGNAPLTQAGTQFPATGQTTSYGTDDDGDVQAGATLRYKDNGDGTVKDLNTQLMWEKKDDNNAGSVHDWSNTYTWTNGTTAYDGTVVSVLVDTLNNYCDDDEATACTTDDECEGATDTYASNDLCGHAGHRDWRLPNAKELQSIVDYATYSPAVDTVFHTSCAPACDVTNHQGQECSCTQSSIYWSSTTVAGAMDQAWYVYFDSSYVFYFVKNYDGYYARAVRGGL